MICHPGARVERLGRSDLEAIFTTRRRFWKDSQRLVPFNLPPGSPIRVEFDRAVLLRSPGEVGRFWVNRRIRGGERPPRHIHNPAFMVRVVSHLPGSIGYVPARYVNDSVRVIARIRNGRVYTEE